MEPVYPYREPSFGSDLTVTPVEMTRSTKQLTPLREDPFSMDYSGQSKARQASYKPIVDRSEFTKHSRGAFRTSEESPVF